MPRNKKKKNQKQSSLISLIFTGAILLCIILWYAYNFAPRIIGFFDVPATDLKEFIADIFSQKESDKTYTPIDGLEIPVSNNVHQKHIILHYEGYVVSYNRNWKIPNWVAYELTREELNTKVPRKDNFRPDENLKESQASLADYRQSGYDRGHMVPAADMRWSATAMSHSFYLTNICPQTPALNRGDWERLESKIRDWAREEGSISIVCGPIVSSADRTIGRNNVRVPSSYYKVVLAPYSMIPRGIGFVFANDDENRRIPLQHYAIPIDSVERLTGIDFFPLLPDDLENSVESDCSPEAWSW